MLIAKSPSTLMRLLDWMMEVGERFVALGATAATCYLGFRFVFGTESPSDVQLLENIDAHWKVLLVLLIPLFYPSIRKFIQEMKKGPFGTEREMRGEVYGTERRSPTADEVKGEEEPR